MTFGNLFDLCAFSSLVASAVGLILNVSLSTSTKSISAPQYKAQLALATNEMGEVQTKSPSVTPNARHATWSIEVALFPAIAYLAPTRLATASSNAGTTGP